MMSSKVSGANLPISSRWPGDSIWKQPSVWVVRIIAKVSGSSSGTASSSIGSPPMRTTSSRAWAIADCIRMPRTSSLRNPISSTASLSNWLIGNPIQLASTGVRSSSEPSLSSTPQGCSATCRGRPSRASTRSRNPSRRPCAASLPHPGAAQLGQVGQRGTGVAGPDVRERLGEGVDLPGRQAERGAHVTDRVAHPVGVHHRHGHAPLAAEPLEDPGVDLGAPGGLHVDVDVGQRLAQRGQEPLHDQAVLQRVDPGDAQQVVDQAARARTPGPPPARPSP